MYLSLDLNISYLYIKDFCHLVNILISIVDKVDIRIKRDVLIISN